jgi:uncharacterized RDD family membrane protein YckC
MSGEKKPMVNVWGWLMPFGKRRQDERFAGFNRRMLAATLDSLLGTLTVGVLVDAVYGALYPRPAIDVAAIREAIPQGLSGAAYQQAFYERMTQEALQGGHMQWLLMNFFWQMAALALAVGLCWRLWQATPGKWLLGMRVVDEQSLGQPSVRQIIKRLLGYVLSTVPLCAGFFWIGLDARCRGWHDRLSGTAVVRVRALKSDSEAAAPSDSPAP